MNELPTLPEHNAAATAAAQSPVPPAPPARPIQVDTLSEFVQRWLPLTVVVLVVLLAALAWSTHNRFNKLRRDMANGLRTTTAESVAARTLARTVQDHTRELQAKVGVLETRQLEAQSQQIALEQLYQDMSKNRDEWALAEIEQVLSTASQQLQLAGNVSGALIALQNADRTLSLSDKPQFISIRRAIARDIETLKGLPSVDLAGVALKLDQAIERVDKLPLLSAETPAPVAPLIVPKPPKQPNPAKAAKGAKPLPPQAPPESTYASRAKATWTNWSNEMWTDVRELVRVRKVTEPDVLMLAPSEGYFVRENLKLRLLNARMALLARNEAAFRGDLVAAQQVLAKYFDTRAKDTVATQATLRQVQANNLAIEMPTLSDSINAVRNYKAKP
ncbi:MAG: uroporphyrinogen-III C-methyltransferase [Pseudomonadota bacterium]